MLNLNYGNQVERLAEALLDRLLEPAADPLRSDWVVVAHGSMARWLAQRKAARDGVCANVDFLYPAPAIWRLLRAVKPELPVDNPFGPEVLALRVLDHFDAATEVPGLEPLAAYLAGHDELGCFRLARRLAAIFDQYLTYRPDWILEWEDGRSSHWQAVLWRRLVAPDDWHWARCWRWLRAGGEGRIEAADLPLRLSVFAVPALAPSQLGCLARFAEQIDIDLYQWSPSRHYWGDAASPRARAAPSAPDGNPLLPSLGLTLRDALDWLLEWPGSEREDYQSGASNSLLGRLQDGLLDYGTPTSPETVAEAGVEVQVCASRRREVETCYDRLLDLFEADRTLTPDQVFVVSPRIDAYLPYVQAVFIRIPWNVQGDSQVRGRGVVDSVGALLEMLGRSQLDRSLLELLAFPPIRRRFGLRAGDLADARRWVREGGLYGADQGKFSWSEGAARLIAATLLGARAEAWPAAEHVHGSEADGIGRLLEFIDVMLRLDAELRTPRPLPQWSSWAGAMVARCLEPVVADEVQMRIVRQSLWRISQLAVAADCEQALDFAVFRELLRAELRVAPAGGAGMGDGVTFASADKLRLIPARVIYALGLNEGEFPAPQARSDLDLIAAAPRRGDRSRRQEDRQVFLEWLGSARERLLLSYVGIDARDGAGLPGSPLVDELLDHLDRHYRLAQPDNGEPLKPSASIVTQHPVQPFSARYGREPGLVSYADHLRVVDADHAQAPFHSRPLAVTEAASIDVSELAEFLRLPAKHYLRRVLGIWLDLPEDLLPAEPPLDLDPLSRYRLIDDLLSQPRVRPVALEARIGAAVATPEGPPGDAVVAGLVADLEQMLERRRELTDGEPARELVFDGALGGDRIGGRLGNVFEAGRVVVHAGAIRGKHLVELWAHHLLLNLAVRAGAADGAGQSSQLIGPRGEARLEPVDDPAAMLERLIEIYREGQGRPIPFFPDASRAFAKRAADRSVARRQARKVFEPDRQQPFADGANPYVKLAFRDQQWLTDQFEAVAVEIWQPLLAHLMETRHG